MNVKVMPTNFGIGLLVKALNNQTAIEFVSMKFGNGDPPEDFENISELSNPLLECSLTSCEKGTNFIQVSASFNNNDVETDFNMTEIGVFANDPELGKVLFAYVGQKGNSEPVYSATAQKMKENTVSVQIILDKVPNVTATIKSLTWVTKKELEDHINDHNNPHKVTASDLGLGNVENSKVQDSKVTFKASENLENINSGETVGTIFGKLYTGMKRLIAHLTEKNNPHKVTAEQVGAAPTSHNHSASAITSGTLQVARGGTGNSKWRKGELLYADTDESIVQVPRPKNEMAFLMQHPDGNPVFIEEGSIQWFHVGQSEPTTSKTMLWIDTTPVSGGLKYYDFDLHRWQYVPVGYSE